MPSNNRRALIGAGSVGLINEAGAAYWPRVPPAITPIHKPE
ncbi:hypothetical protein NOC27_2629 [Nitrosococcus oceani AFC27]|nr:hypothetical protein NOC27_2629 [Nitrosococcus oceani AFC27]